MAGAGQADEVARLSAASGSMMLEIESAHAQLLASRQALAELNATLEKRVANRTADLAAANAELEAFSYAVSHDLRAPLRGIDGFSNLLQENHAAALGTDGLRYLDRVRNGVHRMGELIDDLLELSRVTRGELSLAEVDLSEMAAQIASDLQREADDRPVTCSIQPGVIVKADSGLMRVVLENMLGNAFKYTRDASPARIELGATRRAGEVEIFVRDNGVGFDMTYVDKVFEPFQRLHSIRDFDGTGVGLATVARVIKRHNGKVRAEAAIGKGATFTITLPESGQT
jgi:signal transduction histidine kinase